MIKLFHVLTDTNIGGAGVLLLNQLKYFDRSVFDISVVLPRGSELIPRVSALDYRVLEVTHCADRSFEAAAVFEYTKLLRAHKPDIVHCHGALAARVASLLSGVRARVYTRHCAYPPPTAHRRFPLRQIFGGFNCLLSTRIVAVADAAAQDLIVTGVPGERITVIINGVEPLPLTDTESRLALRRSLGIADGELAAGIFARLEECKGHIYLLRALSLAVGQGSTMKVIICGRGSLESNLRTAAAALGVAERVIFTGFIDDIAPYMNAVDLNLNCSVGTETSSLALSEGMSVGKPAVVSDYGGNPAMVEDGVSGIIVPAADPDALCRALTELEGDRERLAQMGEAARARYDERFRARLMTGQLEELYCGMCSAAERK